MNDYKLSASLEGHEDDVRGVVFPHPSFVLSASRDATVRLWKLLSNRPPRYDCTVSTHGSAFINAVAYLPPSSTYPDGLILSGGKETIVEARQPGKPEENAEALLLGHESNVCALDVSAEGGWVVSGSWDASARVWRVGKWECEALLEGHEGSVWDVLAYDRETIITACADHLIRVFSPSGKRLHTIRGNTDVVRALCRVLKGHPSKAEFASASNDGVIRLWRLDGYQVGELRGHDSFIYSLASLPSGELVSSGEDRTVRIWRGDECVQTITHPAISVWGVAVCQENGDLISGASDRIVRIFSRVKERQAEPHVLQAFEDSVKSSSIPQQAVGEVNKEKLPGPEFLLQKSGTKEGQVVMIREADGSVTAHQWSQGAQLWLNVGTVVDAVGSTGKKKEYQDTDYDYVFDVDIEDGKPPLKLPYNLSQNPYEAATTFIQENHLPMTYLDQVANFITTNTSGATLGAPTPSPAAPPPGADPWGTESRYRPGEVRYQPDSALPSPSHPAPAPSQTIPPFTRTIPPAPRPKVLPQTSYLTITTANLPTIRAKITELNTALLPNHKPLSLSPSQLELLSALTAHLAQPPSTPAPTPILTAALDLTVHLATTWPPDARLPALDLLRLLAAATPFAATWRGADDGTVLDALAGSGVFAPGGGPANNAMLAVRVVGNLFGHEAGRALVGASLEQVRGLVGGVRPAGGWGRGGRNLVVAVATVWVNYAVLFAGEEGDSGAGGRKGVVLGEVVGLLAEVGDPEAVYRGLVAVGTVVGGKGGGEVVREGGGREALEGVLVRAERGFREPRVGGVVAEIRGLVK